MTANGKMRITLTSNYTDGELCHFGDDLLPQERVLVADVLIRTIEHSRLPALELHVIVSSQNAEDLLLALVRGDTEMALGKISPAVEPS
jgi:hypothetical protein